MSLHAAALPPPDPTHLREHLAHCDFARSRLHRLHCVGEALNAFLAPRFITTLAVLAALWLAGAWLLR